MNNYIAAGGHVIYANWTRIDAELPNLGAGYGGTPNRDTLQIAAPLNVGVSSSVFALSNPGYVTFSTPLLPNGPGTTLGLLGFAGIGTDPGIFLGNSGRTLFNGFMEDTFSTEADGVRFFENELTLLNSSATPLPAALPLFATGIGALGLFGWRRKRKQAA